jgi:O-methyltransferase
MNDKNEPMSRLPHEAAMFSTARVLKGLRALLLGPAVLRRRTLHEAARIIADKLGGHYVGDDYKLWLRQERFVRKFKELSPHNYFSMERKFTLKEFARHVCHLDGAVAECGTYVGVSAWFLASELGGAEVFLFDSFEGLSKPKQEDFSSDRIPQWKAGDMASAEEVLETNLNEFMNIHILKGWIPERFDEVADRRFKLVHIDVDLYEPTLRSLEFFYDRMVAGGVIIMDDYGFQNCPGAHRAANEFMSKRSEEIIHLATGQGVIIRRC